MPKLRHTTPCNECPFRKSSLAGWLGGNPAEVYADMVQMNGVMTCHKTIGKKHEAYCAGSLAVLDNSCTEPRYPEGVSWGDADKIAEKDACFQWPRDFYKHHTGREYVNPFARLIGAKNQGDPT